MKTSTRKILLTLAFCFSLMSTRAQYVTIPDTNFVNWLNANGYAGCMVGNQMDTTCNAILNTSTIDCSNSNIQDLTGITYFDNLGILSCDFGGIFNYNPGGPLTFLPSLPPGLQELSCRGQSLTALPALPSNLTFLECGGNYITSLPPLPTSLGTGVQGGFSCVNNLLTSLPLLPPYMRILVCGNNFLTTLPSLPVGLNGLYCFNNQLTSLPQLPNSIGVLDVANNPGLTCLPGIDSIGDFDWFGTGITCLPNSVTVWNSATPSIVGVPICDFWNSNGCGIFRNINGWIFKDANSNCIQDNSESILQNVKVNLYQNNVLKQQTFSNYQGYYSFSTDTGTYTYNVDTVAVPSTVSCPVGGVYTSAITTVDSMEFDKDFSLQCLAGHDVGTLSIVRKQGTFRPGQQVNLSITAGDLSNQFGFNCAYLSFGHLIVTINGPASFVSPSPGALTPTVTGNVLDYFILNFSAVNIKTAFGIILQIDTTAQAFQNVCINVTATSFGTDYNLANNNYTQCFPITNSFDPNEKEVSPSGSIDTSQHELTYTIYFQNTGNDTALHVYLLDTLDNALDESSIQLLAYSHEPIVQVDSNIVKFNFPNINLPDSTTYEPNSHGYVQYRVRIKNNTVVGTQIHNTAFIYFDFNSPVVTNTTFNQIDIITDLTPNPSPKERGIVADIYPNPISSGGELKIIFNALEIKQASLTIFEMSGRKIFTRTIHSSNQTQTIQLPFLSQGIYGCVIDFDKEMVRKKLIVVGKEK